MCVRAWEFGGLGKGRGSLLYKYIDVKFLFFLCISRLLQEDGYSVRIWSLWWIGLIFMSLIDLETLATLRYV